MELPDLYLITISENRKNRSLKEIQKMGYDMNKVNIHIGINGRDYGELAKGRKRWNFVTPGQGRSSGRGGNFTNTEQAICIGQLDCMEKIYNSKKDGIILEDDILFHNKFLYYLKKLYQSKESRTNNDIIYLGWGNQLLNKGRKYRELFINGGTYGMHAVLYKPEWCGKMIQYAKKNKILSTCDHWYDIFNTIGTSYVLYNPLAYYIGFLHPHYSIQGKNIWSFYYGIAYQEAIQSTILPRGIHQLKRLKGGIFSINQTLKVTFNSYESLYPFLDIIDNYNCLKITYTISFPNELVFYLNKKRFFILCWKRNIITFIRS